jgi:hypothetical protein
MKKYLFFYLLAMFFMVASTIASANTNEVEKLAKLAQSCETSHDYQDCVRSKFFNNLK